MIGAPFPELRRNFLYSLRLGLSFPLKTFKHPQPERPGGMHRLMRRMSRADLMSLAAWPGVRRPGPPRPEAAADAGPRRREAPP